MSEVNEKDYELAFEIILLAGAARNLATESINASSEFDFKKAEELIEEAEQEFVKCHGVQTGMLNKEASGEKNDVNIILVHAQDHLTMANVTIESAKHIKKLYETIQKLREEK